MNNKYRIPDKRISKENWELFMSIISSEIEYCRIKHKQEIDGINTDKTLREHNVIMCMAICKCLGFKSIRSNKKSILKKKFYLNDRIWTLEEIIDITLTIFEDYDERIRYRFDNRSDGIYECAMVLYMRFMNNVYIYRTKDLYALTHKNDE